MEVITIRSIIAVILSISLIFIPAIYKVNADPIISSWVIGAFLAVAISMGFYFDIDLADISVWATAKIEAFLQDNGYNSIEAWLGANFESEATFSGTFLGLTPNLYAKLKAAVEFSIGTGSDDLPSGGSESSPVARSLLSNYYLPCTINIPNVGTFSGDYPIINYASIADRSPDWHFTNNATNGYRYQYESFPISFNPTILAGWTQFSIVSNNITYDYQYYIDNVYTLNDNTKGTLSLRNYPTSTNANANTLKVPINNWNMQSYYANSSYNIQLAFIPYDGDYTKLQPCFIYKAINGADYLCYFSIDSINKISAFSNGNGDITAFGVGVPAYNFNNSDLIYIDLQLGQINSVLQALLALIAAINDNLVTWTIALQTISPGDLPVDTTPLIDFVDYCNEQTNLYLSGTSTLASCVGNMYQALYNVLSSISSSQLSNACINAYNAFINKLTLFSQEQYSSSNLTLVTSFESSCSSALTLFLSNKNRTTYLNSISSAFSSSIAQASTIEEIIGLVQIYELYYDKADHSFLSTQRTYAQALNGIVDRFLAGSIDQETALIQLFNQYKTQLQNTANDYQVAALATAYQVCVDRISLEAFNVDPAGLGTVVPEVIQQEDDLLELVNVQELTTMLQFQNWQFMNSGEANLYREYFQKLFDSESPFYVFIYVPLVLGIVGIILGTRIHFGGKNVSAESKGRKH